MCDCRMPEERERINGKSVFVYFSRVMAIVNGQNGDVQALDFWFDECFLPPRI